MHAQTTLRKTKSGYYAETYTRGVKSVVVRGEGERWELAAPDNARVGSYFKRLRNLTVCDLRAIAATVEAILKETDSGTQCEAENIRAGTKPKR